MPKVLGQHSGATQSWGFSRMGKITVILRVSQAMARKGGYLVIGIKLQA